MKDVHFSYESASAILKELGNGAFAVSNVYARHLGQGHGSGVMQKVVDYADTGGFILKLLVMRYGYSSGTDAMSNQELEAFYEKFGFTRDAESHLHRPIRMTRYPKT